MSGSQGQPEREGSETELSSAIPGANVENGSTRLEIGGDKIEK